MSYSIYLNMNNCFCFIDCWNLHLLPLYGSVSSRSIAYLQQNFRDIKILFSERVSIFNIIYSTRRDVLLLKCIKRTRPCKIMTHCLTFLHYRQISHKGMHDQKTIYIYIYICILYTLLLKALYNCCFKLLENRANTFNFLLSIF
jgi:hypothetical protein